MQFCIWYSQESRGGTGNSGTDLLSVGVDFGGQLGQVRVHYYLKSIEFDCSAGRMGVFPRGLSTVLQAYFEPVVRAADGE